MFFTTDSMQPAALGRALEERGFESLWVPEHTHIPSSRATPAPTGGPELPNEYLRTLDPMVALGGCAAVTKNLLLGSGVSLVAQHDPVSYAKEWATLDHVSGGRAVMGVGFGWNKEKVPGGIKSLDQLFSKANKGKVEVLSELRDTIGIILQYQGVDPSQNFTEDQYMNAVDYLAKMIKDGFIRQVKGNDYKEDLISGDAIAVIGWSGDVFQLASENDGKFEFAIPESGGMLWSDNLLIPSTSTNKANAEKVINNYYDPAVAAEVAAYVTYICPVKGAQAEMEKIDPALAASPFIFPTAETLKQVKVFRSLTPAEETSFTTAFQEAAGN